MHIRLRSIISRSIIALALTATENSTTYSETIHVPKDYAAIQTAIEGSNDGDVILVAPGTYLETIDFLGKNIELRSREGFASTIIDARGEGSAVSFRNGEGRSAVVEGFTLTGGVGEFFAGTLFRVGGGVFCALSSPTVRNNRIIGNTAHAGGGVGCWPLASPLIEGNLIESNLVLSASGDAPISGGAIYISESGETTVRANVIRANTSRGIASAIICDSSTGSQIEQNIVATGSGDGGAITIFRSDKIHVGKNLISSNAQEVGIEVDSSTATIVSNRILGNSRGGISIKDLSRAMILNNVVRKNGVSSAGRGLVVSRESHCHIEGNIIADNAGTESQSLGGSVAISSMSTATLVNNTIVGNEVIEGTAGLAVRDASVEVVNTVIWGNHGSGPVAIDVIGSAEISVIHSCIQGGWEGDGNIQTDPRCVDVANGDVRLRVGSPCIDSGLSVKHSVGVDFEGDPRVANGDRENQAIVDIGADELAPEVAVRFGKIENTDGDLAPVLQVNGLIGGSDRTVLLQVGDVARCEVLAAPRGPSDGRFVIYAWSGIPTLETLRLQPRRSGLMSFPTPLDRVEPQPFYVWNSLGLAHRLGDSRVPVGPAPVVLFEGNATREMTLTLQGFLEDSAAEAGVLVTNAVIVEVRP